MAVRVGIISDTHGLLRPEVLDILKTCDCILHCGDIGRPEILDALWPLASLYAVRGNCDGEWAKHLAQTLQFTIGGVEFFMTHDKKDTAWELGSVRVVVCGHSHVYSERTADGRLWLNPGSCGARRFGREATMALMIIEDGSWRVEKIVIPLTEK